MQNEKLILRLLFFLFISGFCPFAFTQTVHSISENRMATCHAILKDGVLTMENALISRSYRWNGALAGCKSTRN